MNGSNPLNSRPDRGLVYSTDCGRTCPDCAKPLGSCSCAQDKRGAIPETDGFARLRFERSAKGKGMTLITGLALDHEGLVQLAAGLKRKFGVGGAVKDHIISLQGDLRDQAAEELRRLGYRIK